MRAGLDGRPVIERNVVRLIVLDANEQALLLHARDVGRHTAAPEWELPGGDIEPGETYVDTAIRRLHEETGIRITRACVDEPTWRRDVSCTRNGSHSLRHEFIAAVRLRHAASDADMPVDSQVGELIGYRWWRIQDIVASRQRFYPRRLPRLLPNFLAGMRIEEPYEFWG